MELLQTLSGSGSHTQPQRAAARSRMTSRRARSIPLRYLFSVRTRDSVLSLSDRGLAALSEPGSAGVLPFECWWKWNNANEVVEYLRI